MPQPTLRQLLDPEGQGVLQTAFRENQANKELVRQGSVMGNPREGFDLGSLLPAGQIGGKLANLGPAGQFRYTQLLQDIADAAAPLNARKVLFKGLRGRPFTERQLDATAKLELLADEINKYPETSYKPVPSLEMLLEGIKLGIPYLPKVLPK